MNKHNLSKTLLFTIGLFVAINSNAQKNNDAVLMTIGGNKVTVSEFENVYHKNNIKSAAIDSKSLDEYIDLFVNFKLKVREAEELGLDTAKSFKDELAGYRKQLAQPYLTDKEVNEKLLQETYNRLKEDIRASHILVNIAEPGFPKDTLEAYNKIMKIRARIMKGEDFNKVAKEKGVSDDPSAVDNGGDLGYFTALQMVYPFESAAYNTKVGEVSMPVRSRYGYHIIKVTDRRKAQGEVHVAHIMIKTEADMTPTDSINAYNKIKEIYGKLKAGAKFEELAEQFSDDKSSASQGGELPWFGTGRMPVEFETTAFALKNKGDYSDIMKTKYGWHIIKLLDKRGLAPFDEMKPDLKAKVSNDSRSEAGRTSLIAKIKKEYNFKENLKARDEMYKVIDTTFFNGNWEIAKAKGLTKPLFNFNNKAYTQADFANYLASSQTQQPKTDIKVVVDQLYNQFVDESAIAYEEANLDKKYPEFKALMQEYRDGILLFELTDDKVWSKAVKDTVGAKAFYEKNKNNYMWGERADASVYTMSKEETAKQIRALLKKKKTEKEILAEINKNSQLNLAVESRVFNKGENTYVDKSWKSGISENLKDDKNNKTIIVVVNKILPPESKSYQDAKGIVTADYQNYLEKEWIISLKKKYPVSIDKTILATIQ
ncbi:MAG: peptidylprolyl isomerase [Bacteroidia bacterium]